MTQLEKAHAICEYALLIRHHAFKSGLAKSYGEAIDNTDMASFYETELINLAYDLEIY